MEHEANKYQTYSRRAFLIGAGQLALITGLAARMGYLQVIEGEKYHTLAEKNRIDIKLLAPSRGYIYDRNGTVLALNDQNFRLVVIPEQAGDLEKALKNLQGYVGLDDSDIELSIKKAKKKAKFVAVEVKDSLSWEEVSKVEINLPDLNGFSIEVGDRRQYPLGDVTAHLVGYVGAVSESDLNGDPVLTLPGFRIGKTGIEKSHDLDLRGSSGYSKQEVNVVGRVVRELERDNGRQGREVVLSIDAELQEAVKRRLEQEKSAACVIMDSKTGAIYALNSHPSYDPNLFTKKLSLEKWEEWLSDPTTPLNNKAVAGQYPPGSTFKMMTALAALESKSINRGKKVYCPGHFDLGEDRFHCWKGAGHGHMNITQALAQSCDTFFYDISLELGIDRIAQMARRFGLGQKYGFEISPEMPGLIPDKDWKYGYFGRKWQPGETAVASIGQGYIQTTPLQLAVMTSRLINGGYAVQPWLTLAMDGEQVSNERWPKINVKDNNLALLKKGMDLAVNGAQGTAKDSIIENPALAMGGKTGTAQVRRITQREREEGVKNAELPWKYRHHALFVGYAPLKRPRYVISVVVEHGGSGSKAAAPVAKDLLLETQRLNPARGKIFGVASQSRFDGVPPKKPNAKGI